MGKLLPASLGAVGAGGAGIGGYMLLNPSENQKVITFKEKYSKSLLDLSENKDESIWKTKLTSLKSQTPNHPDLREVSAVAKGDGGEDKAKPLHKEACRKIYDSPSDNQSYFEDFKKYCSKLIGDLITETWISSESSSDSKWNTRLGSLISKKGELISQKLKDLVAKLPTDNNNNFTPEQRKELQAWCSPQKEQLFLGEESKVIDEIKSYCTGN
ncbi:hypothetical protein HF1_03780 [Mycoplasma haemofelis str. Langford 1]|uniref:Uncharacterized protein n=1 Tax=Mycoplasma haemofelis (strain Langford 1) TaxID=941640 RepID=E8ZGW5_MYCHL|nr:hypothetical protein [Mycoplasma haemofelis]CBY92386.1 hypothetical protein HF1_03780 [Mycoplasma haemofelis str. Langford 1]